MPATVKLASVNGEFGFVKATSPGPLTLDQVSASEEPRGKPSSQEIPLSLATSGSVTVESLPAKTVGGFVGNDWQREAARAHTEIVEYRRLTTRRTFEVDD